MNSEGHGSPAPIDCVDAGPRKMLKTKVIGPRPMTDL
jgi:hypothetical protein